MTFHSPLLCPLLLPPCALGKIHRHLSACKPEPHKPSTITLWMHEHTCASICAHLSRGVTPSLLQSLNSLQGWIFPFLGCTAQQAGRALPLAQLAVTQETGSELARVQLWAAS